MNWTSTPPTQPGWYWWRDLSRDYPERCVEVFRFGAQLMARRHANDYDAIVSTLNGEWCGPLPPPGATVSLLPDAEIDRIAKRLLAKLISSPVSTGFLSDVIPVEYSSILPTASTGLVSTPPEKQP